MIRFILNCILVVLNVAELSQALGEQYAELFILAELSCSGSLDSG